MDVERKGLSNFKLVLTGFLVLMLFFNFNVLNGQHTAPSGSGSGTQTSATSGTGIPIVKIRPVVLDLCNNIKHVYFKVSFNGDHMSQSNVRQVQFTLRKHGVTYGTQAVTIGYLTGTGGGEGSFGETTTKRDTFPWSTEYPDYIDLEFYNIINVDDDIELVIKYYNQYNVFISEVNLLIPFTKEEGIVDVTDHLGAWIDRYMDQGTAAGGLMTSFCGKEISQIELVAFFKDYFGWSEVQICNFVQQFNLFTSISSGSVNVYNTHFGILCTILEDWQSIITGDGGDEEECHCKLIRTDSDAGLVGYNYLTVSDGCKNYNQKLYEKHFLPGSWTGNDDDDLLLLSGRMGAAKGEIFYAYTDGCEDLPKINDDGDNGIQNPQEGYGYIKFKSLCIDPLSASIPVHNCMDCKKEINLMYNYSSYGHTYARKGSHICGIFRNNRMGVTMEEFAALVIDNNKETKIEDQMGYKLVVDCNAKSEWGLDSILNTGKKFYEIVKDLSGIGSYVDAALIIGNVIGAIIDAQCEQISFKSKKMEGTKTYILNPGERFSATLFSQSVYRARGALSGTAWATNLSDYFLTAVVKTIPDTSTYRIAPYCVCETIATYSWGSLGDQLPSGKRPRDRDKTQYWPEFDDMYKQAPHSIGEIKGIIGSFIGLESGVQDWKGKFENAGCCAVIVPCHADCVYIIDCGSEAPEEQGRPDIGIRQISQLNVETLKSISQKIDSNDPVVLRAIETSKSVKVYPNPGQGKFVVEIVPNSFKQVATGWEVFDMTGQKIISEQGFNKGNLNRHEIDLENNVAGQYIIRVIFEDGTYTLHKVIKL